MIIQLDFDGTLVNFNYPSVGILNTGCVEVLEGLFKKGHIFHLNTYRANISSIDLENALDFLKNNELMQFITTVNTQKKLPPSWDIDAAIELNELFLDDDSEGIPLKWDHTGKMKMVDWRVVKSLLKQKKLL
jgi:hypothetical protein